MTSPDFEALRAERNAAQQELLKAFAARESVPLQSVRSTFNPHACYCACASRGPCEHKWDGPDWESSDGCASSVTCSRCGCTAMSHDMRVLP